MHAGALSKAQDGAHLRVSAISPMAEEEKVKLKGDIAKFAFYGDREDGAARMHHAPSLA